MENLLVILCRTAVSKFGTRSRLKRLVQKIIVALFFLLIFIVSLLEWILENELIRGGLLWHIFSSEW